MILVLAILFVILPSRSLCIIQCPEGTTKFGAYPDTNIDDPGYYYDCSRTEYAILKKCNKGEYFDIEKSKCLKDFPISSRVVGGNDAEGANNPAGTQGDVTELTLISAEEKEQFLKRRGMDSKMKQPVLGRAIQLGAMVYEQEDRIAYDENLWTDKSIETNKTVLEAQSSTFRIRLIHDALDRLNLFNIEASFKISLLEGKLVLKGAGKFLTERKKTEKDVNIAYYYESIRQIEFINQGMRMAPDFPEICKDLGKENGPTHVVTSITRGLSAVLEFKKKVRTDSDVSKIIADLEITLDLPALTLSGKATVNLTENETRIFEDIDCTFYGDTILDTSPTTLEDGREVIKTLPQKALEAQTVIFYDTSPISKYCDERSAILNRLSEERIKQVEKIMQEFDLIPAKILDLLERQSAKVYSQTIGRQMHDLLTRFEVFETEWKQNISIVLPKIRGNVKAEWELVALVQRYQKGPFAYRNFLLFLNNRKREMDTLDMIINSQDEEGIVIEESSNGNGNECIFKNKFTVQYTLHVLPAIDIVGKYVNSTMGNNDNERNRWFWNEKLVSKAGAKHRYFMEFYHKNYNKKENNVCYLIRLKDFNETINPKVFIDIYDDGDNIGEDFQPPSKLKPPKTVNALYNEIDFHLDINMNHTPSIDSKRIKVVYEYEYEVKKKHDKDDDEDEDEDDEMEKKKVTRNQKFELADFGKTQIRIKRLRPNTTYEIECMIWYPFGVEQHSIKFPVTTSTYSEPRHLQAVNVTTSSIVLSWEKPRWILGSPDNLRYKIVYSKVKFPDTEDRFDEEKNSLGIIIEDDRNTTIRALEPNTEYIITVEAIYSPPNATFVSRLPQALYVNGRTMIRQYTFPNPPRNLNATLMLDDEGVQTCMRPKDCKVQISWDRVEGGVDASRTLYTLYWEVMEPTDAIPCKFVDNDDIFHKRCVLKPVEDPIEFQTPELTYTIDALYAYRNQEIKEIRKEENYYRFRVKVTTPQAESVYSHNVTKLLKYAKSSTKGGARTLELIDIDID